MGRNIQEQLGDKFEFFAPGHKELDLLNERAVEKYLSGHTFDVVVHSATTVAAERQTFSRRLPYNLRIFLNFLRCEKFYGRMVFLIRRRV